MRKKTLGKVYLGIAATIGIIGFVIYGLLKMSLSQLGELGPLDRLGDWLVATNTLQTVGGKEALLNTWASLTLIGTIVFGGGAFIIGIIYIIKEQNENSGSKKEAIKS
jgi:hypothetical protein